jgi:chaperonin cofactor prefoldin
MENEALLAKLQEQLQTAIEGHRQIAQDLRTIFNRVDEEGKTIVRLESEMKSNVEKDKMRKETIDLTITALEKTDEEVKANFENFKEKIREEEQARKDFEVDIKATFKLVSWIIGGVSFIGAIIATIVAIMTYIRGH